jgi:hypothetical protein
MSPLKQPVKLKFWTAEAGIAVGLWFYLLAAGRTRMLRDPGTLWHTVVGRRILFQDGFFDKDPFSFTFAGRTWIPHQWLGECCMALAHQWAGLDGLLLLTVTVLVALYSWLARRFLRNGLTWLPTCFLILLGLATAAGHFLARPHVFTFLAFGLTCGWLADVESGCRRVGNLWQLIPLYLVWSNTHGGMLAGLATLLIIVSAWSVTFFIRQNGPIRNLWDLAYLGLITATCAATPIMNPYGTRLPGAWLAIVGSPVLPKLIAEHAPAHLGGPDSLMISVLGMVYVMILLGVPVREWRATWLLPFVWMILSFSRVRNAPLFSISVLSALAGIIPHSGLARWLAQPGRDLFQPRQAKAPHTCDLSSLVVCVLTATAVVLQTAGVRVPLVGSHWAYLDPRHWPVGLLPELRDAEKLCPGGHVLNSYLFGGFLIYETPGLRVFIDDRCELYGDAWLTEYDRAEHSPRELAQSLGGFDIDYALVQTGSLLDRTLSGWADWPLVARTSTASFYRHQRTVARGGNRP